jgi:hypothetical protein
MQVSCHSDLTARQHGLYSWHGVLVIAAANMT